MSTLKVNGIRHTGASSDAITTASDGTCTAKLTNRSNRNLVVNGAMMVAVRATTQSVATGEGIDVLDRWKRNVDLPSGISNFQLSQETDAPDGFNYSLKVTPNQSRSGALSGSDRYFLQQKFEGQVIRNSGWNFTNPSDKLTFSFYVKSNLTGALTVEINSPNSASSSQLYHEAVTINSANTWERKSFQIIGNSNLAFDNDTTEGLVTTFILFAGPNFTSGSFSTGSWHDTTAGNRCSGSNIDMSSSSSNYVMITGVQLELGDTATRYDHIPYSEELPRCQRYYSRLKGEITYTPSIHGCYNTNTSVEFGYYLPVRMRADPTASYGAALDDFDIEPWDDQPNNLSMRDSTLEYVAFQSTGNTSRNRGDAAMLALHNSDAYIAFNAEL